MHSKRMVLSSFVICLLMAVSFAASSHGGGSCGSSSGEGSSTSRVSHSSGGSYSSRVSHSSGGSHDVRAYDRNYGGRFRIASFQNSSGSFFPGSGRFAGGAAFYYGESLFHSQRPEDYGYLMTLPPPGTFVPVLPEGWSVVYVNGRSYYQSRGACYIKTPAGYEAAPSPVALTQ